jgi:hypothetical protein
MRGAFGAWSTRPLVVRRFALSAALLVLAASLLAFDATHSGFTARSGTGAASFNTGIIDLAVGADGPANRLTVDATGIVPGDRMERVVDLTNGGTFDLSGVTLTTTATLSSALDTNTTHGLQVSVDRCSAPWTEAGTPPGYVYGCSGTTSSALSAQPVIMTNAAVANLTATTAGNTDHLRVVLTFPPAAGDAMQGLSSHLAFTFTGSGS